MSIESKISYELNKHPGIKKGVKRVYQRSMYAISPKLKSEGDIVRVSPDDGREYFFGYYDKSPWDITGRYMLCMRANNTWSDVSPKEKADIILIDTTLPENNKNRLKKIAETSSWNVQQSCMLQWLGPDYSSRILFNDCRNGKYVAVIKEVETGSERIISAPVYTVSPDGKTALTLDFSRLYNLRPGYGYYNIPERTKDVALPDATAVWKIGLESGDITPILTYKDFATFQPRQEMLEKDSVHKVNHLMISPNGKRCMVLYRWFVGQRKYTRLVTFDVTDGGNMYVLSDDDMVSHCFWKNDNQILAFENKKGEGSGYYLMDDRTQNYVHLWKQISNDGHPSYSPDGKYVVTDSYPNRARVATIKILKDTETGGRTIAKVFAPFKYDNDTRCDLHPRWSRDSKTICFDSVFEGHRGLYIVDAGVRVPDRIIPDDPMVSCVIPTYQRSDTLSRAIESALSQTYKNLEVLVVDDNVPGDEYSKDVQALVKQYENTGRVRYVGQEKHINGAAARNAGIKAAKGFYIAFLDDDDEWNNEKIQKQVDFLKTAPEYQGASCLYQILNKDTVIRKCPVYTSEDLQLKVLMRSVAICTPTFIGEKAAIEEFGGFNETLIRHQDLQFFGDFLEKSKIYPLPEMLVTVHSDSSANKASSKKLIDVKKQYLAIEEPIIKGYSKKDQKRIKGAHYFEIVLVALREKKISTAVKYTLKVGPNLQAYKDLLRRMKSRE